MCNDDRRGFSRLSLRFALCNLLQLEIGTATQFLPILAAILPCNCEGGCMHRYGADSCGVEEAPSLVDDAGTGTLSSNGAEPTIGGGWGGIGWSYMQNREQY